MSNELRNKSRGRIGVFDSGLGGLFILKALSKKFPKYDFMYLGDTKHLPYGKRSQATIYKYTKQAVDYLFQNNCQLIILACNSASARALRRIQQDYLPQHHPDKRVLGVIIPTVEMVEKYRKIGILATTATIQSKTFVKELKKINPKAQVRQVAAPPLVPLIESGKFSKLAKPLKQYLKPLKGVEALVLGCTHYPIIEDLIQAEIGPKVKIVSQTDIIPPKLLTYLTKHTDIRSHLSQNGRISFTVTKLTPEFIRQAQSWFGKKIILKQVKY